MASHRSQRLKTYGGAEIEKLDNSRWRVIIRCEHADNTEGWFEKYRADTFPEFDTLASAPFGSDPASAYDDQYYADQRLISASLRYIPQKPSPVVEFIYETLTSTYTNEVEDVESSTENGLRTLERVQVARPGTAAPYDEDDVGVSTLTSGGKTLYLAGFEDASTERIGRIVTRWAEAGILREFSQNLSEGVKEVTIVFLAIQGSTVGPVVRKREENYLGLKTFSITTLQDKDGNSLVSTGENLVHRYTRKAPFTYPGSVKIRQDVITSSAGVNPNILNFELFPPVQANVDATISVIFQTASAITAADETYNDGTGAADSYWNPTEWARTYVSGIGWNYAPFSASKGLRGYRVNPDVTGIAKLEPTGSNTFVSNGVTIITAAGTSYLNTTSSSTAGSVLARVEGVSDNSGLLFSVDGKRLYAETPFILQAEGGPVDPSGTRYVLDIDIRPAFEDVDGNIYYKKTIVTATP